MNAEKSGTLLPRYLINDMVRLSPHFPYTMSTATDKGQSVENPNRCSILKSLVRGPRMNMLRYIRDILVTLLINLEHVVSVVR